MGVRRSVSRSAVACTFVMALLFTAGPANALPAAPAAPAFEPRHIPGGITLPDGTVIHLFLPGPKSLGFMGKDVEPSTMTDFRGFSAQAYVNGTATDDKGNGYTMQNDLRVYSGQFVGTDGLR